ncbi:MAG: response regulator [Thermoflexales bacterium]|nr:response regulator [Thermoflexales bacterium]
MSPRILVVEDDASMLQGICDALDVAGYETQAANGGAQALACLEQSSFDLILSDIMMPGMDGYELFEKVRSNMAWTTMPFIFLTARGQKTDIRLGKQMGADDYLVKPFEVEDLLITVQSKLERARALQHVADAELKHLKQGILNTLSHEFRTPLTYISGYAELLQDGDISSEEFKVFLQNIRKGSDRLRRLVEDFLFMVALETGEVQSAYQLERKLYSDLAAHLAQLLDTLEERAVTRGVSLTRELSNHIPPVYCHINYILDAAKRLVDNGLKFSKQGGMVTVRAWANSDRVHIAVSDEGIGISPERQSKLFERFSQIDRETMEQPGTGIGLFIVKNIVTLHEGDIRVSSTPGMGSTFTISLPAYTNPTQIEL